MKVYIILVDQLKLRVEQALAKNFWKVTANFVKQK